MTYASKAAADTHHHFALDISICRGRHVKAMPYLYGSLKPGRSQRGQKHPHPKARTKGAVRVKTVIPNCYSIQSGDLSRLAKAKRERTQNLPIAKLQGPITKWPLELPQGACNTRRPPRPSARGRKRRHCSTISLEGGVDRGCQM